MPRREILQNCPPPSHSADLDDAFQSSASLHDLLLLLPNDAAVEPIQRLTNAQHAQSQQRLGPLETGSAAQPSLGTAYAELRAIPTAAAAISRRPWSTASCQAVQTRPEMGTSTAHNDSRGRRHLHRRFTSVRFEPGSIASHICHGNACCAGLQDQLPARAVDGRLRG